MARPDLRARRQKVSRLSSGLWLLRAVGAYVLLQFSWWAYLLTQTGGEKAWHMVLGEGSVFAFFLVFGLVRLERGIKKERARLERERHMFMGVTHELKTPLAAVQLGVDTLRRVKLSAEDEASVLGNIQTGVKDLERRVNDMLVATRLQGLSEVKAAPFSWDEAMRSVVDRLGALAQGRLTCPEAPPGRPSGGRGRELWGLAVANLIENALKHSTGQVHVAWQCDGYLASVEVVDEGEGIAPADREQALKPFSRLTEEGEGTGLGLYLVAETVRAHGAQLEMEQKAKGGFSVRAVWPQRR